MMHLITLITQWPFVSLTAHSTEGNGIKMKATNPNIKSHHHQQHDLLAAMAKPLRDDRHHQR